MNSDVGLSFCSWERIHRFKRDENNKTNFTILRRNYIVVEELQYHTHILRTK